jgi:hypothetical protein
MRRKYDERYDRNVEKTARTDYKSTEKKRLSETFDKLNT